MTRRRRFGVSIATTVVLLGAVVPADAGDPAAAERQYRIARRLAAEGSAAAAEALQRVIELDPDGVLADDALVEQALLERLPRWPEDLGELSDSSARVGLKLLRVVATEYAQADRLAEARYYQALLRLEPLPSFDESAARFDLVTVATNPAVSEWTQAARYTGAWLAAHLGHQERAGSAYSRLLIDAPRSDAATRAAVGLARLMLRDGRPGQAARLLQLAVEGGAPPEMHAAALRQLAIRLVLAENSSSSGFGSKQVVAPSTGLKDVVGMNVIPGGLIAGDPRGQVLRLAENGSVSDQWTLPELQAVTVDELGRIWAATIERIYRLQPGRPPAPVAELGEHGPPTALSVEATGRIWLVDRKGETVSKIDPASRQPVQFLQAQGSKLVDLAWDGRRLLAIDSRRKDVVVLDAEAGVQPLGAEGLNRPQKLVVDVAGRLAVLDAKETTIHLIDAAGRGIDHFACRPAGVLKPEAVSFGLDGALHILDASSGAWVKLQ